jgi:hypothetical protein
MSWPQLQSLAQYLEEALVLICLVFALIWAIVVMLRQARMFRDALRATHEDGFFRHFFVELADGRRVEVIGTSTEDGTTKLYVLAKGSNHPEVLDPSEVEWRVPDFPPTELRSTERRRR